MKKKVSGDIRALIEHCVSTNERALFVIVGDKGRFQVANLHYLLQRVSGKKPNVLWCYKKALEVSSHQRKRQKVAKKLAQKGLYDESTENPYELFLRTTDIRYCYYRDSQKVLGQTFGVCVLQDFEALTPNVLCRTIETVEGGGMICILLRTMESLQDLYNITMDAHGKLCSHSYNKVEPRFVRRFVLSLSNSKNIIVVDDELNILPICKGGLSEKASKDPKHKLTKLMHKLKTDDFSHEDYLVLKKLAVLAVTHNQLKALIKLLSILIDITNVNTKKIITIISDRGRGKSATIGLFLSSALYLDFRNILVVAPSVENVSTLFAFLERGLKCLGIDEHVGYTIGKQESYTSSLSLNSKRNAHVKYVSSSEIKSFQDFTKAYSWEILIIEEAASIPLPIVEALCTRGIVIISSTVGGYEGTGRSISLKLIEKFKRSQLDSQSLTEIKLNEPIRYSKGDSIELWLNNLLCLNYSKTTSEDIDAPKVTQNAITPSKCKFLIVNRNILFSHHPFAESFLNKVVYTLKSSHYRNSPDDLLLLSDAPAHKLLVLAIFPEVDHMKDKEEDVSQHGQSPDESAPDIMILCVVHIALEGKISKDVAKNTIQRGVKPSGDMIPWTMTQHYYTNNFSELNGMRIVRIAVPQQLQRLGYGSEAIKRLISNANIIANFDDKLHKDTLLVDVESLYNLHEYAKSGDMENMDEEAVSTIDYIGTSFGLSSSLIRFWNRMGFRAVYARQVPNEATGEFSCIMLLNLNDADNEWLNQFIEDFKHRVLSLAGSCWKNLPSTLVLSLISGNNENTNESDVSTTTHDLDNKKYITMVLKPHDLGRLERYSKQLADFTIVTDLIPKISTLYFEGRIDIRLSFLHSVILLAVGNQFKTPKQTSEELKMPLNQVMALLQKVLAKISKYIYSYESHCD